MNEIEKFIQEAEKFKKDPKYQTMPLEIRDFFNEELGRFKFALEIVDEKEREKMCQSFRIKKMREITDG